MQINRKSTLPDAMDSYRALCDLIIDTSLSSDFCVRFELPDAIVVYVLQKDSTGRMYLDPSSHNNVKTSYNNLSIHPKVPVFGNDHRVSEYSSASIDTSRNSLLILAFLLQKYTHTLYEVENNTIVSFGTIAKGWAERNMQLPWAWSLIMSRYVVQ